MNENDACMQLCRRYGLQLLSLSPGRFGGSHYVAKVRDEAGRPLLLKQSAGAQGLLEAAALRAWTETRAAAHLVQELGEGASLVEWLDGVSLADVPLTESVDLVGVGRMVRSLHTVATPKSVLDVRERLRSTPGEGWQELTREMRALAGGAAERLLVQEPAEAVLLHGDLVPSNVILTSTGPKVIDPNPAIGLRAWDIAQLAVAAAGRGRHRVLRPLLEGYGTEPPLMAEMYAWMVLWFLQRNLAAGRAEFSDNLRPLAEGLVQAGLPKRFLREQLAP